MKYLDKNSIKIDKIEKIKFFNLFKDLKIDIEQYLLEYMITLTFI